MVTDRIFWIDLAKFAGISLVVFDHVVTGLSNSGIAPTEAVSKIQYIVSSFHVPLFFFLAGFIFPTKYSSQSFLPFTLKKWDRLVYLCIVWSILQALSQALFAGYTNHQHSFSDVLSVPFNFMTDQAQFWFLYALFCVTAASAAIYRLGGNSNVILIVALTLFLVADRFEGVFALTFAHYIYFAAGICIAPALHEHIDVFSRKMVTGLVIVLFILIHGCAPMISGDSVLTLSSVLNLAMAVSGTLFVLIMCVNLPATGMRGLGYLGRHSMEILLMHIMVAAGLRIVFVRILGIHDFFILVVTCTAAGILLPVLAANAFCKLRLGFFLTCPDSMSLQKRFTS